jgi:microcystin-dependent protein
MASTFTALLNLEKPAAGDQDGLWADTLNRNFDKIDAGLSDVLTIDISAGSQKTLTSSTGAVSETESAIIKITGTLATNFTINFPNTFSGMYLVENSANMGSFTITFKNSSGTGVAITSDTSTKFFVYSDTSTCNIFEGSPAVDYIVDEIRMFAGTLSNLPTGWFICNGSNGTVDLRNKFVYGATGQSEIGNTGGASSVTSGSSTVDISGTTDSHTLTVSQIPAHRHFVSKNATAGSTPALSSSNSVAREFSLSGNNDQYVLKGSTSDADIGRSSETGSGSGHTHGISLTGVGAHTHSVSTLPPYYKLAYIQYKG